MKPNIGLLDRSVRLFSGLVILGGAVQMKRQSLAKGALLTYGALKITEGVTGWCPVMYALGIQDIETTGQSTKQPLQRAQEHASAIGLEPTAQADANESHTDRQDEHANGSSSTHGTSRKQGEHGDTQRDHRSEHTKHNGHPSSDKPRRNEEPRTAVAPSAHTHEGRASEHYQ